MRGVLSHQAVICILCRLMPIQQCELVLVHLYPHGDETLVSDRQKKEVSRFCKCNASLASAFDLLVVSDSIDSFPKPLN